MPEWAGQTSSSALMDGCVGMLILRSLIMALAYSARMAQSVRGITRPTLTLLTSILLLHLSLSI